MKTYKIAFIYGPYALGGQYINRFNLNNLWTDARGLTGSELSYFRIATEMAAIGHEVHLFSYFQPTDPTIWNDLRIHELEEFPCLSPAFPVAYSWNEPDPIRNCNAFKLVNLQINSFSHCRRGFEDIIDLWTSPSVAHRDRILQGSHLANTDYVDDSGYLYQPDPNKWMVVNNGCDPERYDALFESGIQKVPGRVIWASSPDRGLHWLLQEWPKIKKAVPHAHLRIFYKIQPWIDSLVDCYAIPNSDIAELVNRARYIKEALQRLSDYDIEVIGSVSRDRIMYEMMEAQVLAYSCDPVHWTEGFSVSLMEACAARTCPISTAVDALNDIYGKHIPLIPKPVRDNVGMFSDMVIRALSDSTYRNKINIRASELAHQYTWKASADALNMILQENI
jgi:glycosyltransferase involved in cell wall biosynthesis